MEWLNLHTSTLDSPAFLGSEPVDRATWLCLMRYCMGQENGGTIAGARAWGDRRWQQLVRVTLEEINRASELWSWDDAGALVVRFYPLDKQQEVQRLRVSGGSTSERKAAAARANGAAGGRPKEPNGNPTDNPTRNPTANRTLTQQETHGKPIEGKGMEGKGREGKGSAQDPTPSPLADDAGDSHIGDTLRELLLADSPATRQEWAALCLEGKSESDEEDARVIRWTVRTQRAQGLPVRYAREALPALPGWAAYKRKLAAAKGGA